MAPAPNRNDDEGGTAGSVITGHRIALTVQYNGSIAGSNAGKSCAIVTPVEEEVGVCQHSVLSSCEDQKVTHVDDPHEKKIEPQFQNGIEGVSPSVLSIEKSATASPTHSESSDIAPAIIVDIPDNVQLNKDPAVMLKSLKTAHKQPEYLNGPDQVIPSEAVKTWAVDGSVKLRIGDKGSAAHTPISLPTLLRLASERFPNRNALAVKRDGVWRTMTYPEYYQNARTVAKAFIKLGLERLHAVCILGFNSPEWFLSSIAASFAGGIGAGIYTTNSPEACRYCAHDCQAQIWVVEDQKQLDKVLKIRDQLPHLKTIIQYTGKPSVEGVLSWEQMLEIGRRESDVELEERLRRVAINQCCVLIYTSGTTGTPKGVMLSHDNITWTGHAASFAIALIAGKEVLLSYLPLSHIAAQMADVYVTMTVGATVYFAMPDALRGSLGQTLKEVRPTKFLGVPRVWEKIYEKMMDVGRKTTGVKRNIAIWAKSLGLEVSRRREQQIFTKPFGYALANALVYKKVKAALGFDRCNVFLSGAAPVSPDIVQYFHSLDICVTDIYGMSESTAPHTLCTDVSFKLGSAGRTILGCSTLIDKPDMEGNGEVCMGGRNVCMGYLGMEEKTHEAIDDEGWLHTGDVGRVDEDGYLFITGRLKELIITAGGENIPPVLIEEVVKKHLPCISNCMLIGDKRKFLSILLTFKTNSDSEGEPLDTLAPASIDWCRSIGSPAKTIQDVLLGPDAKVMRAIQDGIDRTNAQATSNAQKIQKWTILPRDFTIGGDELGPSMKLKRPVVLKKFAETIERFYA